MQKLLLISALTLVGGAAAVPATAQTPPVPSQTLYLDLHEKRNDGYAGPVRSKITLTAGAPYVLTVRGTGSLYRFPRGRKACGKPESKPIYSSRSSKIKGAVGVDAEFVFGALRYRTLCPKTGDLAPRIWNGFRVDVGRGYKELTLLGGPLLAPTADHSYVYGVVGTGAAARLRISDKNAADNYGRFRIDLRRATTTECLNGNAGRIGYPTEAACAAVALPG